MKTSVYSFCFLIFFAQSAASSWDKKLAKDIISNFRNYCIFVDNIDSKKINEITSMHNESILKKKIRVNRCFDEYRSKIIALNQFYSKICSKAQRSVELKDDLELQKMIVWISKYSAGIRPLQNELNGCLQSVGSESKYIIKLRKVSIESSGLFKALVDVKNVEPYKPNRIDYK